MKALIVINAFYTSQASAHQCRRMKEELEKRGVESEVLAFSRPWDCQKIPKADFAVFFDKDVAFCMALEKAGIKVFNGSEGTENADDKIKTAVILSSLGLPMPKTLASPKRYVYEKDNSVYDYLIEELGLPLVVKKARSSLGMGVYLAKTKAELIELDEETGAEEKLFQSYEEGSKGESYRVIVVGGKAVASMRLKSENDFRSNAHNGGIAEKAILGKEYLSLAEKAAEGLKLDYCGVDLFCDQPSIIEVNGNAYFENAERVSEINIAGVYAEYILEKIRR